MGTTIAIKDVDDDAYRSLKGEATRSGIKVGEAASSSLVNQPCDNGFSRDE